MKKSLLIPLTLATYLLSIHSAFANCEEDVSSDAWKMLSSEMNRAYEDGRYEEALNSGKRLSMICDRSPVLNYTMSMIYMKLGNETESFNYIRRATEFTNEYTLPQPVLEKIWLSRAEQELPYKRELGECKTELTETQKTYIGEKENQISTFNVIIDEKNQTIIDEYERNIIIGSSIAGAGLALTLVGAPLLGIYHKQAKDEWDTPYTYSNPKGTKFNRKNEGVMAGFATLGIGLGAGIAGAAIAIYNKVKLNKFNDELGSEKTLSFQVSPNSIAIDLKF